MPYKSHERRAKGLCIYCRNSAEPGLGTCRVHLDKAKERHAKRTAQGLCKSCDSPREENGVYCLSHRTALTQQTKAHHNKKRRQIVVAYGGACVCCGEDTFEFLTFDHVHNDGADHRRQIGRTSQLLAWIIKNDYPDTLQLLCYNCNCAKGFHGVCPHQLSQKDKCIDL
jgi:hypothetical protein